MISKYEGWMPNTANLKHGISETAATHTPYGNLRRLRDSNFEHGCCWCCHRAFIAILLATIVVIVSMPLHFVVTRISQQSRVQKSLWFKLQHTAVAILDPLVGFYWPPYRSDGSFRGHCRFQSSTATLRRALSFISTVHPISPASMGP